MQLPDSSVAEIMGQAGYDWVALDLEHGLIAAERIPELCRALELGGTLPLARVARGDPIDCSRALDAGAAGLIIPMVESAQQLTAVRDYCRWPPAGRRGVGFSRANLFGKHFQAYRREAQCPLLVAMLESVRALDNLDAILQVEGVDAVLIGPYDLSASMSIAGQFDAPDFCRALARIREACGRSHVACGIHVVGLDPQQLHERIREGYRFIAYCLDAMFLISGCARPDLRRAESS